VAASLDLLEAKARIQSALATSRLARGQGFLPHLDLGAVAKREAGDGAWGFGPEVSTAIPIFDQGTAKVLSADARARQGLARHTQLTVEVSAAARRLAARAAALREREVYVRETYLPLRTRLVSETLQTFNAMQIGAFDVLDAKEGEAGARREHVETRTAAWLAALDLGELLAGSLNRDRLESLHLPENAERPTPPKGH
jgi:outer membrane protein TolC